MYILFYLISFKREKIKRVQITIFQEDLLKHNKTGFLTLDAPSSYEKNYDVVILDPISGLRCNRSIQQAHARVYCAHAYMYVQ